jgi:hypothetical protein
MSVRLGGGGGAKKPPFFLFFGPFPSQVTAGYVNQSKVKEQHIIDLSYCEWIKN